MKKSLFILIITWVLVLFPIMVHAQLQVTPASELSDSLGWNAEDLVRNIFLNSGVDVRNVRFNGSTDTIFCDNIGIFDTGDTPTNLGIESGIIIATGNVKVAEGPNTDDSYSLPTNCGITEDPDLQSITTGDIKDGAVLEFDFVPYDSVIMFNYVFGSDEYTDYVGSQFNDIFGFFVSEVPLNNGSTYYGQNMALIPNTNEVVSINTVHPACNNNFGNHPACNSEYFVNNPLGSNTTIQFNGFTTVLEVRFNVVPMQTYHLKMAICDINHSGWDSGVFLASKSLSTNAAFLFVDDQLSIQHPDGFDVCQNDSVLFNVTHNFNPSNIVWNFGDGESGNGIPISHCYDNDTIGTYEVSCNIYEQDSLVSTLSTEIHVHEVYHDTISHTDCDSYTYMGQTFTESGYYNLNEYTVYGCDSITTLHLTIHYSDTAILNDTACDFYYWHVTGTTYYQSGVYDTVIPYANPDRCDSIYILNLTIYYNDTIIESQAEACDSYYWEISDSTYLQSGTHEYIITTSQGCTHIERLNLTIGQSYDINLNDTVCDFYPWASAPDGFLTQSGHYAFSGHSILGCDSIVNLDLIVNQTPHLEIHGFSEVAISTDLWPGIYNYCLADSAELHGCDIHWSCSNPDWIVIPTPDPIWCKLIANSLGQATLTAVSDCGYGCDTQCSLDINASHFDIDEIEAQTVTLFPNPAHGQVTIHAPQLRQVKFYNNLGMVSKDLYFESTDMVNIDINDLAQGFYIVEVITSQGKTAKKLILLE